MFFENGIKVWFFMEDKGYQNIRQIWEKNYDIIILQEENNIKKVLEILNE